MVEYCTHCNKKIEGLPFKCKYCGRKFCENHRLPEDHGCGSTYSNNAMAKCFVDGWIGSSGHHKNMISRSFSMSGVGIACDSLKCRATQVFSG